MEELNDRKKYLEKQIQYWEQTKEKFSKKRDSANKMLKDAIEELDIINERINNKIYDVDVRDKIIFKDSDDIEIKVVLGESSERYYLILLSDYTTYDEDFKPYYIFDFNARLPETTIVDMCERYELEVVKIIKNK